MYSEPTGLLASAEYPYTIGVGTPCLRTRSIVATSLAVARSFGCVEGYGRRAMTWRPSRIVNSNTRLKPPSANLQNDLMSSFVRLTDLAAASSRADTLNIRRLSSNLFFSLYLRHNQLDASTLNCANGQPSARCVVEDLAIVWDLCRSRSCGSGSEKSNFMVRLQLCGREKRVPVSRQA